MKQSKKAVTLSRSLCLSVNIRWQQCYKISVTTSKPLTMSSFFCVLLLVVSGTHFLTISIYCTVEPLFYGQWSKIKCDIVYKAGQQKFKILSWLRSHLHWASVSASSRCIFTHTKRRARANTNSDADAQCECSLNKLIITDTMIVKWSKNK